MKPVLKLHFMMEVLNQFQKKKNNFLKVFLFLFIFFCNLKSNLAKVFSNFLELNVSFTQGGVFFGKTNSEKVHSI